MNVRLALPLLFTNLVCSKAERKQEQRLLLATLEWRPVIRRVSFLGGLTNIGGPVTSYPCGKMSPRSGPESTMCNESNTLQGKIDLSESVAESRVETELLLSIPKDTNTIHERD